MGLKDEIERGARQIKTDAYSMSIGELLNLYRDNELDLHPDFQRFFRWDDEQKSRLIESVLLGIPLPSIFVFQRKDGVWDVIDGVQRLSTLLQLTGDLKGPDGEAVAPLVLTETTYLPSLKGKRWESEDANEALSSELRIAFRRAKLDLKIVKSESSEQSKYDLFQRLNTGGTPASEQEIRNCILIMQNKPMYQWLSDLSDYSFFKESLALSDRLTRERYDMELALRFILLKDLAESELRGMRDLDLARFLTSKMSKVAESNAIDFNHEEAVFKNAFKLIYDALEDDGFKKYDVAKGRFTGSFSVAGFEAVALGLGAQLEQDANWVPSYDLAERVRALWEETEFKSNMGSGISSSTRIPKIVPFARQFFGR